jgi:hypothetical protein
MAARKTPRAPNLSATQPLTGMKTARLKGYAVIARSSAPQCCARRAHLLRAGPGRVAAVPTVCPDNDPSVAALSTVLIAGTAGVIVVADRWFGLAKLI